MPKPVIRDSSAKSRLGDHQFRVHRTGGPGSELAADLARDGHGVNHMRIRAFPFTDEVTAFADRHDFLFVVEQNRDAQMRHLLIAEAGIPAEKLVAVTNVDGMPLTAAFVEGKRCWTYLERDDRIAAASGTPITAAE